MNDRSTISIKGIQDDMVTFVDYCETLEDCML